MNRNVAVTFVLAAFAIGVMSSRVAEAAPGHPAQPLRCGTPARIASSRLAPKPTVPRRLAGPKLDRESFGPGHQLRTSENFGVRWRDATVLASQIATLTTELEKANTLYLDTFGHRAPIGSETYRMNVYISAGPNDDPAIDFDGGYANLDDEGYPYMVISASLLADPIGLRNVASHELYHDFQLSRDAFALEHSYWWWEATAEWAAQEMMPDEPSAYYFVGAFALAEEVPLFYMGDPFGGSDDGVTGVHQYGASVFPQYFSDTLGDRGLVPSTWETAGPNDDALDVFMGKLASDPEAAADRFGEFAARTALWDVPRSAQIVPNVRDYESYYPTRKRIDASVAAGGTDWATVPAGRELRAYGYHTIEIARPSDGQLRVVVEPGSAGTFRFTLVRQTGSGITYTPVVAGTTLVADLAASEPTAWLVVAVADAARDAMTFTYRYRVGGPLDQPGDVDGDGDADGESDGEGLTASCSTSSVHGLALGFALLGLRRRRRAGRDRRRVAAT